MTGQPSISSLLQPPASLSVPKASIAPTPDIIGKLKKLEEHFGKEGFGMAIKEGSMEKAKLGDMEMMYLVCLNPLYTHNSSFSLFFILPVKRNVFAVRQSVIFMDQPLTDFQLSNRYELSASVESF